MSESRGKTKNVVSGADQALLEEHYEFVSSEKDDARESSWQDRMVQRYNDGLYKEHALADLSRPERLGLRWRTRQEVLDGRGERTCGNKRCLKSSTLVTIEVPFLYQEKGVNKKELVKLRLCDTCLPLVRPRSSQKSEDHERVEHDLHRKGEIGLNSSNSSSSQEKREKKRKRIKRDKNGGIAKRKR